MHCLSCRHSSFRVQPQRTSSAMTAADRSPHFGDTDLLAAGDVSELPPASYCYGETIPGLEPTPAGCGYGETTPGLINDKFGSPREFGLNVLATPLTDSARLLFAAIKSKDAGRVSEVLHSLRGKGSNAVKRVDVKMEERLSIPDLDLSSRNDEGHTFLGIACEDGSYDIVELLIQHGANLNGSDFFSETPLQYASEFGHTAIVQRLIAAGADIDFIEDRLSALHIAACKGQTEVVKLLINSKCNVNILNKKGVTPLHCAVSNGQLEVVRLLLEAKAHVNVKGQKSDRTPLFMAGEVGDIESAKLLLQFGANLNMTDQYGMTPLNVVCNRNNPAVAHLFISAGAKLNVPDRSDSFPLHYATRNGASGIVQLLLNNDAKVDVMNKNGESPLHLAIRMQYKNIIRLLIDHGCDVNICNESGVTPLFVAVNCYTDPEEFEEILFLLDQAHLSCNLNCATLVSAKNRTDLHYYHYIEYTENPLYRALNLDKADIALVLLQQGADVYVECPHDITIFNKACQRRGTSTFVEMLTASSWKWRSEKWLHPCGDARIVGLTSASLGHFMNEVPLDAPAIFWNKSSLYWKIQEWLGNTLTLQQACRVVIRGAIRERMRASIELLNIPRRIKDFLMLKTLSC